MEPILELILDLVDILVLYVCCLACPRPVLSPGLAEERTFEEGHLNIPVNCLFLLLLDAVS